MVTILVIISLSLNLIELIAVFLLARRNQKLEHVIYELCEKFDVKPPNKKKK